MCTTRRLRIAAALSAFACTLAVTALASAAPLDEERYYSSYGTPESASSALAQERYYSSYGNPEPRPAPDGAGGSADTPLFVVLSIGSGLVLVTGALAHRHRKSRRHAVPA